MKHPPGALASRGVPGDMTAKDKTLTDVGRVRAFIADELETRERSMLPTSDSDDRGYIDSARAALAAADRLWSTLRGDVSQTI